MSDELRPFRTVAIFPLAVGGQVRTTRQADLGRGFACLMERRLSTITGLLPLVQHLFLASEGDPKNKGWLVTNSMWRLEQLLTMPFALEGTVTHVLHGRAHWEEELSLELELVDLRAEEVVRRATMTVPPEEAPGPLFEMMGDMARTIMEPSATASVAARIVGTPVTWSADALESCVLGLAAWQSWQNQIGGPAGALRHLAEAIEADPACRMACEALEEVAVACLEAGPEEEKLALATLTRVAAAENAYAPFAGRLGLRLAESGDTERARDLLERYLETEGRGPLASRALETLARLTREDPARAHRFLERAVRADGENVSALEQLAQHHAAQGAVRRAEELWRRALQLDPDRPETLLRLGESLRSRGRNDAALSLAGRALAIEFNPAAARLFCAVALAAEQQEEADRIATEWVENCPEDFAGWITLAGIRRTLGDIDAAWHCLGHAARLASGEAERAQVDLLEFHVRHPKAFELVEIARGQLAEGRSTSRAALMLTARRLEKLESEAIATQLVRRVMVQLYTRLGELGDAIRLQEAVLLENAADQKEALRLVDLYRQTGRHSQAVGIIGSLLDREETADLFELRGDLLLAAGDREGALADWERAVPRSADPRGIRRKMMDARLAGGRSNARKVAVDPPPIEGGILRRLLALLRRR